MVEHKDAVRLDVFHRLMIMVEHDISLSNSLLLSAKLCLIAKPMVNFMGDDDHRRTLNEIVARLKTHVEQHIADADLESGDVITENICAWVVLTRTSFTGNIRSHFIQMSAKIN